MTERRSQAQRSADSRERLLVAAIQLLGQRGYAGTSLAAIGARAGLSRGLVTHHFGTKEQCVIEVVRHIRRVRGEEAQRSADLKGLAALDAFLDNYLLDETGDAIDYSRAMLTILVEATTASEGLLPVAARHNDRVRDTITAMVDEAITLGEIAPQDSSTLAVVIEGILRGVMLQWLVQPDRVDRTAVTRQVKAMVRFALADTAVRG